MALTPEDSETIRAIVDESIARACYHYDGCGSVDEGPDGVLYAGVRAAVADKGHQWEPSAYDGGL